MLIVLSRCLTETADGSDELTDPEGTQAGSLRYIGGHSTIHEPVVSKAGRPRRDARTVVTGSEGGH
jgi:hypothetical protein